MSNSKTFWTAPPSGMYAKRNNIFLIQFDFGVKKTSSLAYKKDKDILEAMSGIQFEAKSVNLPSFSFSQNERSKNLAGGGDVAVVPGVLDWTPVTLTFADIHYRDDPYGQELERDESSKFSSLYESMLYAFDRALGSKAMHGATAFDHNRFRRFFENIMIISIDARGRKLDQWALKGTWPVEFKSPDLNYDNDAIREFSITLDYIIAEYTSYDATGAAKVFASKTSGDRTIERKTLFSANSRTMGDVDEGLFPGG